MRTTSFIHATATGKDLIVLFALDVPGDPEGGESLTLQRSPVYQAFLPPEERGVVFHRDGDPEMLAEVRWGNGTVELAGRDGWRMEIDLRKTRQAEIDRAMAVIERMNFDGAFRLSGGTAPAEAKQELMLDALASDKPDEVRYSLAEAQNARELLTEPLLDLLTRLTPEMAEESNVPAFAIYLLAAWRETRALEPLIDYLERGGDAADDALGDVIVQDLPSILGSIAGGRFDLIRRLIESKAVSEWVRVTSIDALIGAAVRGEIEVAEVEAYIEELMTRTERTDYQAWSAFAGAAADLASERLAPHIERAYADGLVDETVVTWKEVRRDIRGGRERAFAQYRKTRGGRLVDDVVETTRWWDFFSERPRSAAGAEEEDEHGWDGIVDRDDRPALPGDIYRPVEQVVRATPKTGRNDPCPCGSGKKFKKCCGG